MFPLLDDNQFENSGKTVDSSIYPIIGIVAGFGTAAIIAIAFFCRRYDGSVSYCIARWRKKESNPEIQPEKDEEYEREAQNSIDEEDRSQKICKPFRCCIFQDQTEEWTNAKHAQHIRAMRRQEDKKMNVYLKSTTTSGFRWKKKWRERKVISKQRRKLKYKARKERNRLRMQRRAENEANDDEEESPESEGDENNVDGAVPDNRSFKNGSSMPQQENEQDGYDADDDDDGEEERASLQWSQPEPANQRKTSTDREEEIRRVSSSAGLNVGN